MAKLRWKGTDEVEVRVLRLVVKPGDVVDVPDDLIHVEGRDNPPGALVWPEENWGVVEAPKGRKAAATKPADAPSAEKGE